MFTAQIDSAVRVKRGEPTLWLEVGEVGVIRSVWHMPDAYYEVEIRRPGEAFAMRALLAADQIEVIAPPPRASGEGHVNGKGQQL
jgi:hypothetical protein